MKDAQRIRITEPGWGGYTGPVSNIMFENGISVDLVPPVIAQMIGAIIRVEACDDGAQVGAGATLKNSMDATSDDIALDSVAPAPLKPAQTPEAPKYTREQLESIADAHGVTGIREIATGLGVRGRSIVELIDAILAKGK